MPNVGGWGGPNLHREMYWIWETDTVIFLSICASFGWGYRKDLVFRHCCSDLELKERCDVLYYGVPQLSYFNDLSCVKIAYWASYMGSEGIWWLLMTLSIWWLCDSRASSFCLEDIFPTTRGKEEISTAISIHCGSGERSSTSVDG